MTASHDPADLEVRERFSVPPEGCSRGIDDPCCGWQRRTKDPNIEFRDEVKYDENVHPWCLACEWYDGPVPKELQGWRDSVLEAERYWREKKRAELEKQGVI